MFSTCLQLLLYNDKTITLHYEHGREGAFAPSEDVVVH